MTTIEFDVVRGNDPYPEITAERIARAGGRISVHEPNGPGGGNDRYVVDCPDDETAIDVLREVYGHELDVDDLDIYRRAA